jgi:hypothetical protein
MLSNRLYGSRVTQKNQKVKADISLLNCVLINPEFVRVISSQARSFLPSLGIYFELHSAEMYAITFKAKFLATVLPFRDKLFKRKEGSLLITKKLNKFAETRNLILPRNPSRNFGIPPTSKFYRTVMVFLQFPEYSCAITQETTEY